MVGLMVNYHNLQKIIENFYNTNNDFKDFLKFLNYISEQNFIELFFLLIFSTLKYEMLKNNKFDFSVFKMNNKFCKIGSKEELQKDFDFSDITEDYLKTYKDYKFNKCNCYGHIFDKNNNPNSEEKSKLFEIKSNLNEKCQKIIFIEMENFRNHLGIF